jgi:hypothetical protein
VVFIIAVKMKRNCAMCLVPGLNRPVKQSPARNSCLEGLFRPSLAGFFALALVVVLANAGCGRNDIQVYRVAKEVPISASVNLPAGWQEVPPGEMRVAAFRVNGQNGKMADVGITPLPGAAGSDLANVNRWRGQVGAAPVSEEELAKLGEPVQIAGQAAHLYDQAGSNPGSGDKNRILAAILRREGTTWFFKMTGDDEIVAQQKPAFISFFKGYNLPSGQSGAPDAPPAELPPSHPHLAGITTAQAPAAAAEAGTGQNKPEWQVPGGWKEVDAGGFLVAKFQLDGPNNAQAFVNVSTSGGDGGGLVMNINRWRGQLGLAPLSDADLNKQVQSLDVNGGKATVIEMQGTDVKSKKPARLFGAIVPQEKQTWFYKLMGDENIVEREKSAFTKFLQTAKYN